MKTVDVDRLLRFVADSQRDPLPEGDRVPWAEVLKQADVQPPRPRRAVRHGWVLAAGLCAAILCLIAWSNVGTEDFNLSLRETGPDGSFHFQGGFPPGTGDWRNNSLAAMPDSVRLMDEEMWGRIAGGDYKLLRLTGVTIGDCTIVKAWGEVQTRFGVKLTNVPLKIPFNTPLSEGCAEAEFKFTTMKLDQVLVAIHEGRAERLEPRECTAEGYQLHFDRWRFRFPEFGTVIYWVGKTCSVGNR